MLHWWRTCCEYSVDVNSTHRPRVTENSYLDSKFFGSELEIVRLVPKVPLMISRV